MPAARPRNENCPLALQSVCLSLLYEADAPAHGIVQVDLAFDHVGPGGAVGILEIRHESRGPRVERVDHHFAVGRPGDLHAAVQQILRLRCDRPFLSAKRRGFWNEIGGFAAVEFSLAHRAPCEHVLAARFEGAMQPGDKPQGRGCQNLCSPGHGGPPGFYPPPEGGPPGANLKGTGSRGPPSDLYHSKYFASA